MSTAHGVGGTELRSFGCSVGYDVLNTTVWRAQSHGLGRAAIISCGYHELNMVGGSLPLPQHDGRWLWEDAERATMALDIPSAEEVR